jgi:ADP-ribosylation factor GTPase-activating protein 1
MDAWNPDQLKRMQAGGNGSLNTFFAQYGVTKHTDIKEKYNSKAAEFYREKIRADVDGKPYTPPAPSTVTASLPRPKSYAGTRTSNNDWDDWGADANSPGGRPPHAASSTQLHTTNGAPTSNEYSLSQLHASAAVKEDFFARKMQENASKPEGLAPSQGGKYVGFGSTPAAPPRRSNQGVPGNVDDVTEILSKGLSGLGSLAGQAAVLAKERAAHASMALKEAGVTDTLGQTANVAAEKTKEYGSKGWSLLKSAYVAAASTIEQTAAQQGYQVDLGSKNVSTSRPSAGGGGYAPVGGALAFEDEDEQWGRGGLGDSFGRPPPQQQQSSYGNGNGHNSAQYNASNSNEDNWGGWDEAPAPAAAPAPIRKVPSLSGNGNNGGGGGGGSGQQNGEWTGWDEAPSPSAGAGDAGGEEWGKW